MCFVLQTHVLLMDVFVQNNRLDHVSRVMSSHPSYLEHFLRTQHFILRGDGPLPYDYRHLIAIMVSSHSHPSIECFISFISFISSTFSQLGENFFSISALIEFFGRYFKNVVFFFWKIFLVLLNFFFFFFARSSIMFGRIWFIARRIVAREAKFSFIAPSSIL